MLSKLMKYEMKATARTFLPLFGALLGMAIISKLLGMMVPSQYEAPRVITLTLYGFLLVAVFVMTFVVTIQRFYKSLLSEEGYLMFTLPVKPWMHIVTKMLVSALWIVTSLVTVVFSIAILAFEKLCDPVIWSRFGDLLGAFYDVRGAWLFTVSFVLLFIISLFVNNLLVYASIAVGHLVNDHKILASIGAYFGLTTVSQILFMILGAIPVTAGVMPFSRGLFFNNVQINSLDAAATTPAGFIPQFNAVMLFMAGFTLLIGALYYILTHVILTRKLNLE